MNKFEVLAFAREIKAYAEEKGGINSVPVGIYAKACDITKSLEEEINKENNKKNGKSNLEKAMKAVISEASKTGRTNILGAWIKDGVQYVCDTYRIIANKNPIDIISVPDDVPKMPLENFLANAKETCIYEIKLPSIAELKNGIKLEKEKAKVQNYYKSSNKRVKYIDKEQKLSFNAQYLVDILTAVGDNYKAYVNRNAMDNAMLMYIVNDDVECLVLCINIAYDNLETGSYLD